MKVKVCGLTQTENVQAVQQLGVDMLGFIFAADSPRYVGQQKELAQWLVAQEDQLARTARVGVFVNAEMDEVLNAVHDFALTHVQLHGNESPGYCRELQLLWSVSTLRRARISKAFGIDESFDFSQTEDYAGLCDWFVFDTADLQQAGGTGRSWDWQRLQDYSGPTAFLLSGGIGPEDAQKVRQLRHPQLLGVDLNSRFEVKAGLKDVAMLEDFLRELGHE